MKFQCKQFKLSLEVLEDNFKGKKEVVLYSITGISIMENIKKKKKKKKEKNSVWFSRADAFSSYLTTM